VLPFCYERPHLVATLMTIYYHVAQGSAVNQAYQPGEMLKVAANPTYSPEQVCLHADPDMPASLSIDCNGSLHSGRVAPSPPLSPPLLGSIVTFHNDNLDPPPGLADVAAHVSFGLPTTKAGQRRSARASKKEAGPLPPGPIIALRTTKQQKHSLAKPVGPTTSSASTTVGWDVSVDISPSQSTTDHDEDDDRQSNGNASDESLLSLDPSEELLLGSPHLPSVGSKSHRLGVPCKPCPFPVCKNGVRCQFCHLCKPGLAHLHLSGNCRPCLFVHKPEGCQRGQDCSFCHLDHDSRVSHRRHLRTRQRRGKVP